MTSDQPACPKCAELTAEVERLKGGIDLLVVAKVKRDALIDKLMAALKTVEKWSQRPAREELAFPEDHVAQALDDVARMREGG